jgi:hypothetical protein
MVEIDGLRFSPMSETDHIPARIKLARRMAGLETQAALLKRIPQ